MKKENEEAAKSISEIIEQDTLIKKNPELKSKVISLFDFTQYLLDDDQNLTKTGNLTSAAKSKMDERIEELFEISVFEENDDVEEEEW